MKFLDLDKLVREVINSKSQNTKLKNSLLRRKYKDDTTLKKDLKGLVRPVYNEI